ncbi:MAG: lamin tail domain-containing protein, partial [Rhodococcus sp. (in: high G+C Gram-positive bacteria)]
MHPFRTRSFIPALIGLFAVVLAGIVMVTPAFGANTDVKINEFSSNNPDFIELINTGSSTVDLSGWVLKDNSENNSYTFPAGSSIAAGAIKGVSGESVEFVFGLGNGDSVRLFAPGGVLIDSFDYPAHPPAGKSYGRCPNGTGPFVITAAATKGAANSCPLPAGAADVKVNEVRSDPDDIVELTNIGSAAVNIGGY